eukprot:scaffold141805_cov17-Tisochrysis_lutea.AAC.1
MRKEERPGSTQLLGSLTLLGGPYRPRPGGEKPRERSRSGKGRNGGGWPTHAQVGKQATERKFFSRGKERGSKGLTGCRRVLMRTQTVDSSRERAASRRKGMLAGSTEKPCPYPGACTPSPGAWGVCVMLESCRGVSCPRCRDSSI